MALDQNSSEMKMDTSNLFREEVITDRKIGTLRILNPVKTDGTPDNSRQTLYIGETQVMTQMGALPLAFQLESETLAEAIDQFPAGAQAAVERAMQELEQMRRESASSIVVPGSAPADLTGGGGILGGGNLRMR